MERGSGRPAHYACGPCCMPVLEKRHRKILSEEGAGKASLHQMLQLSATELLGYDVEQAVRKLMPSHRYICKSCQDELNQWEKLKDQMTRLKQQLITKLDTLCTTAQSTAGPSRPPAVPPKSLAPKRLKLHPGTSPEVVVCYCLLHACMHACIYTISIVHIMSALYTVLLSCMVQNVRSFFTSMTLYVHSHAGVCWLIKNSALQT